MPRIRSILSLMLALIVVAGLGWCGKEAGKRMARAGWFRSEVKKKAVSNLLAASGSASAEVIADPKAMENALRRMVLLSNSSIYLPTDWETLSEVRAVLAGLSSAELAAVYAALEKDHARTNSQSLYFLLWEVMQAWVTKDPAAALTAGMRNPLLGADSSFASWAQEDPGAALDWLDGDGFPAGLAGQKEALRAAALYLLLDRDFERASAEFLKLPPSVSPHRGRDAVIGHWAAIAVNDPALRDRLVAFAKTTGRPEDHAQMNNSLLRTWPQEDSLGMLTYLSELRDYMESSAIPAEKRPAMDATAVGAAIYREYDRPALEWWMERYGDQKEVPGPLQEAMIQWRQKNPQAVEQWFAEQPPSPQRDAMHASLIPAMIAVGKMTEAAQAIETIGDAELKQSAIERLDYVWSKKDPAAAAAWRGKE